MKNFVLIAFILINISAFGQSITNALQQRIAKEQPGERHRIRVEFKENIDCYYWNQEFTQQQRTPAQRAQILLPKLQHQANTSQNKLLNDLDAQYANQIKNVQPFWIVNIVVLEAQSEAIDFIANFPTVSYVDLEENTIQMNEYIEVKDLASPKAIGAPEPGLIAINAPALWRMGYTGRGQVVFDFDTGVWPSHPSFSNRFLARHYPMEQCWDGYYSATPTGAYNSHGTHTLGTMLGVDTTTRDTIGVAHKAYWIANDHIRSTVAELPPITDMIASFEWALNPDGDPITTHDIPEVINNSWRWYDEPDTLYCGGMVVNLMNAIEAVGIANVFSGGNFGPSNSTISSPQRINTSDVNTFSVGSINANVAFPYPISSFSSIGPKQCPGSGALAIHPEVVAPGQNVRSAWGRKGYYSISGTSMAAPHVSGAVLLLKEAFPMASGETILRALYTTAVDMGPTGEDNTFGMGLIDCLAAFNELALTYTPHHPDSVNWDLNVVNMLVPKDEWATCNTSFAPTFEIRNDGRNTITSATIEYGFSGSTMQTFNWSGNLMPGISETVTLPTIAASSTGKTEFILTTSLDGLTDYDVHNNRRHVRFTIIPEYSLPYLETFENNGLDDWRIDNADEGVTWETDTTGGLPNNLISAKMPFFFYSPIINQIDGIASPNLNIGTASSLTLKFDRAYENINSSYKIDSLKIYVSTDCGSNWSTPVYHKWGADLYTIDTINVAFVPSASHHWVTDSVDLSAFVGNSELMIRFEGINRKGQNLYLDNIRLFEASDPVTINEEEQSYEIYPNPAAEKLVVTVNQPSIKAVVIRDLNGKLIHTASLHRNRIEIDVRNWAKGTYVVQIGTNTEKLIVR